MVQYTLAQSPDVILTVPGKDSPKARDKAMEQLIELMDDGKLPTDLSDGFSPQEFIEVKESKEQSAVKPAAALNPALADEEDAISQAVQTLSNLATLKMRVQASRDEAMHIRSQVDLLFGDDAIDDAEIARLKDGFKVLKAYAQANLRYMEARVQAEQARVILDQALNSSSSSAKSTGKK